MRDQANYKLEVLDTQIKDMSYLRFYGENFEKINEQDNLLHRFKKERPVL